MIRLFFSVPPFCYVEIKSISSVKENIAQEVVGGFAFFGHSGPLTDVHDIRHCRYMPIWKDKTWMCGLWFSSSLHICLSQAHLMSNARRSYCLVGFCFTSKERQFLPIFSLSVAFFWNSSTFRVCSSMSVFVTSSTTGIIIISFASYKAHVVRVLWRVKFSLSTS